MLATVASVTSANRLKKYAERVGYDTKVIQTPVSLTKEGCGYSLRFKDDLKPQIAEFASELGIKIRAFWREENGEYIKV
ncbi:MAG: DUF3343 domain-containing protein [Clostridia bacterium]|nr:DUF3343 domain-containing protein [Clostridia bacterium]